MVWICAVGVNAGYLFGRLRSSLYGSQQLMDFRAKNPAVVDCLYFHPSPFYTFRDHLDGVVIEENDGPIQFCLNEFSPRYSRLLAARCCRLFEAGLFDPSALESQGLLWRLDGEIDRKDEKAKLARLTSKYGLGQPMVMNFKRHTAEVAVRRL